MPDVPVVSSRVTPPGPVVLGSTVDIVCEAGVGDLPISFTWTDPNGVSLNSTNIDGTASITLSSGGYGKYNCTATNEFGMDTAVINVEEGGIIVCLFACLFVCLFIIVVLLVSLFILLYY